MSVSNSVASIAVFGDNLVSPNRIAAITAMPPSSDVSLSDFRSDASWWTGLVIVNPSQSETIASMSAFAPSGDLIESYDTPIFAHNRVFGMVKDLFNLGSQTEGWIRVTSSTQPVSCMEILSADDMGQHLWGMAGIESQPTGSTLCLPHFDVSDRWWTLFSLANPGAQIEMAVVARDESGTILRGEGRTIPAQGRMSEFVIDFLGMR